MIIIILLGNIVNAIAIIAGGFIGSIAKKGIPERFSSLLISSLGLFTMVLGIKFALNTEQMMVVVVSLVIGSFIGELINIEKKLNNIGERIEGRLKNYGGNFSQGFVTASLLFCVGSMAIMGSLQSGLAGNHETLYTKSFMDGIISIVFASTMGIGVMLSSVPVFIYQGIIVVLSSYIAPYLNEGIIREMTATGGVLLLGLSLNILDIKKIKVGNMLPSIFIPILIMLIIGN